MATVTSLTALGILTGCSSTSLEPLAPIAKAPAASTPAVPRPSGPSIKLIRPAEGPALAAFNGTTAKGVDIGGKQGDSIVAAADGRVSYVGKNVRRYGDMVIVSHNGVFLTAYTHTSRILVKEDDMVRQGQKIAEMGDSGTDRVKLHFELRRYGIAVNPQPYF